MDISQWPLPKIMMLPDHLFGIRQPLGFSGDEDGYGHFWFISEASMADVSVIWELWTWSRFKTPDDWDQNVKFSFAMGDHLPTSLDEFDAMENMFPEFDEHQRLYHYIRGCQAFRRMKKPFRFQGRRIVLQLGVSEVADFEWACGMVFSGIPHSDVV